MISDEAVEAAARVLLDYTGECMCHEGYSGRNLVDPDCRFHDVPPEVAREILEAAAPHMLADAKGKGWRVGYEQGWKDGEESERTGEDYGPHRPNPYRSQA